MICYESTPLLSVLCTEYSVSISLHGNSPTHSWRAGQYRGALHSLWWIQYQNPTQKGEDVVNHYLLMLYQLNVQLLIGDSSSSPEFWHNREVAKVSSHFAAPRNTQGCVDRGANDICTPWQRYDSYINGRLKSMLCTPISPSLASPISRADG